MCRNSREVGCKRQERQRGSETEREKDTHRKRHRGGRGGGEGGGSGGGRGRRGRVVEGHAPRPGMRAALAALRRDLQRNDKRKSLFRDPRWRVLAARRPPAKATTRHKGLCRSVDVVGSEWGRGCLQSLGQQYFGPTISLATLALGLPGTLYRMAVAAPAPSAGSVSLDRGRDPKISKMGCCLRKIFWLVVGICC